MKRLQTSLCPVFHFAAIATAVLAVGVAGAGPALASPSGPAIRVQILPGADGGPLGPDGRHHDAFVPSTFQVPVGRTVTLTIVNHDMMRHSMDQPALGLDVVAQPARMGKDGAMRPSTTVVRFTVKKPGRYRWYCTEACDDDAGSWDMSPAIRGKDAGQPDRDGFMAGYIVAK